jgi:hypothetical protein
MDWNTLIMTLLGGTSIIGLVQAVRYRKENKRLKENEVKLSNIDAQKQEIDLAEMYKDKVVELAELMEQVSKKQDSGNDNQARILQKLDTLDERMDKVEGKVSDIVTYLNGDFQDYLARVHQPKPRKPRKQAS